MIIHVRERETIRSALVEVNRMFDGNVRFKREPEWIGFDREDRGKWRCTLTVADSRGPGGRIGRTGRRIAAACWHVHGFFIDAIFDKEGNAKVETASNVVENPADNWKDQNIGSMMEPLFYSEACECAERGVVW